MHSWLTIVYLQNFNNLIHYTVVIIQNNIIIEYICSFHCKQRFVVVLQSGFAIGSQSLEKCLNYMVVDEVDQFVPRGTL